MVKPTSIKTNQHLKSPARVVMTFICILLLFSASAQSKYVKKFRPLADSLAAVYEIPVSIILGVAILESGSGTSRNAKLLNNHFGIAGKNKLAKSKGMHSRYKQYSSPAASFTDFCRLLAKKKFYPKLKGTKDYRPWIEAIAKAGYSEMPLEWKKRITATIKKNKLSATH